MLEMRWESIASHLANVNDEDLSSTLLELIDKENIDLSKPASVFFGRDTRHVAFNKSLI